MLAWNPELDGCDCINIEGYPCRLSEAWCTAEKPSRISKAQNQSFMRQRNQSPPRKPTHLQLWGLGKQDRKQHLASFVRESSEESNSMVWLLPASPCETTGIHQLWRQLGKPAWKQEKAAPSKTFRMALIDQQKKTKKISNSPKSYALRDISVGCQVLLVFVFQTEPVRKPEPCDLWGKSLPRWSLP